jgi:hypothetical protein
MQVCLILLEPAPNEILTLRFNGRQQATMAENSHKGTPIRFEMVKTLQGQA